ncbi:MAG TPA: protein kinase [Candidatus Solibacter sp.]|nr:protein kinase [Candidatus Solibacter sp.]
MIGKLLDHYRILAEIGRGGMAVVYRAHDEVLDRDVAVKVLAAGAGKELGRDHLLHEAQTASSLAHPNICTIYQVGRSDDEFYIVMELVEGQPLTVLVGANGLPFEVLARYGVQIADALAHAHDKGTLHRDLKGANIFVTREGRIKILDFGLATRVGADLLTEVTRSYAALNTSLVGTLPYMAPELLKGEPATEQSDIWSLGVTLYHAVCGSLPFPGKTGFEISSAILHQVPPQLPAAVPPGLVGIILRCLAKESAQRFQRASEVRAALEIVQGATLAGREPATPEPRGPRRIVLRGIEHHTVRDGDVLMLVGTTKGAFLLRSTRDRKRWDVAGPYFHGHGIPAMVYDGREGRRRLWLATNSVLWGSFLRSSDDFGKSWTNPAEANVKFPAETGAVLKNIWQLSLGEPSRPDVLYCGVEPAAMFESSDAGESWSLVRGLFDHPHRPRWMPGNGGLMLHTILPDPGSTGRMYVAISAGGVYTSDDGGKRWTARNRGIRVTFMPEKFPEFGQCVHKIALHPARPERLFLQNHWGIYRSDDAGETWRDIANGVPSDFGFPVVIHPRDPDCVYVLPVESDEFRCTPDGHLRVYRTRNAGASWEPLSRGLPQKRAYETVLRDAMTADELDPTGLYFGTRSGALYGSRDEGRSWTRILEGLPAILCVKIAVIGQPRPTRRSPSRSPAPLRAAKRAPRARGTRKK